MKRKWLLPVSILLCIILLLPATGVSAAEPSSNGVTEKQPWDDYDCTEKGHYYRGSGYLAPDPDEPETKFRRSPYAEYYEETCGYTAGYEVYQYCWACKKWIKAEKLEEIYAREQDTFKDCMSKLRTKKSDSEDHVWEAAETPATCTKAGSKYQQCKICGAKKDETEIPKLGHNYQWEEFPSDDCTEPGVKKFTCTRCGDVARTETVPSLAKEHTWESDTADGWVPLLGNEPTCYREGELIRRCKVCGLTEKKAGTMTKHQPEESKDDCTKLVCKVCGTDMGPSDKEHDMVWEAVGAQDATGLHIGSCKNCRYTVREGHTTVCSDDCTKSFTCEKCGVTLVTGNSEHNKYPLFDENNSPYWNAKDNGDGTHTRICSNNGCDQLTGVTLAHEDADNDGKCDECGVKVEPGKAESPEEGNTGSPETGNTGSQSGETLPPTTGEGSTGGESENKPSEDDSNNEETHGAVVTFKLVDDELVIELPNGREVKISATNITETSEFVKAVIQKLFTEFVAYDITLTKDNIVVQPDGTVKVYIKLPAGWEDVTVYHIDGDKMIAMPTTVENGYAVFTTTHFSVYALVNNKSAVTAPETDETKNDGKEADITKTEVTKTDILTAAAPESDVLTDVAPKTDDEADVTMLAVLGMISLCGMCVVLGKKKYKH